jgi:hypothetical protein
MRRSPKVSKPFAILALVSPLLAGACFHSQYRTKPRVAVVGGDPIVQMTPPGELPSLDHPSLVPIERHSDPPPSSQPLVGMRVGEEERGYPLGLLERYEVVNDQAADVDYVVARCALTDITAVYDRRVGDRLLTFINSGALWRDTLVLQDRETGTLWTAATGQALFGPLAGERLRPIPAVNAPSRAFRKAHPAATYLDTRESTRPPVSLSLYAASPWQGISGVKTNDRRYDPKEKLFFVAEGSEALAFRAEDLKRLGRVEDTLAGRPILLEWDAAVDAPAACRPGDAGGEEAVAVVPAYWFALDRHFRIVRTLSNPGPAPGTVSSTTAAR